MLTIQVYFCIADKITTAYMFNARIRFTDILILLIVIIIIRVTIVIIIIRVIIIIIYEERYV